ncbi:LLM class F420-dependent oxidoreductase [Trebonia kvetii]|uniref:LLM class F420-dependent oxidoreductase n=1 Tax=Trebonia kvetii TaxID=2480626 RepID=A0A6P2BZ58_9ACTN|nr:LLM class F420-dependent oxidoreductase [Trebonia kvetii]TVZ04364.1 LLM class F420-dependent oxidoreductase [Trebonia kvetii]
MKLGLHISDFTWDGGAPDLRFKLGEIAKRAEDGGVDRISVMDHVWQIGPIGPPEHEMLEAYTALGWLAAKTERVKLLTMVTAVVYREPGLLAKAVTTLDVLSGGRAILGIGAAWNAEESAGLGLLFPPVSERFERLEEAILICKQMWSGDEGAFHGQHYQLARTLNSPQVLSRPHPPILIGGAGEKKTLRLVAKYADACNIAAYNLDETAHKLDVLRQHCANEGRDYDEIEKTAQTRYDLGENGENTGQVIENLHRIAELGFSQVHGSLKRVSEPGQLDLLAERVIPAVEKF